MKTYSALVVIFLISLTLPINIHSQNKSAGWNWSEEVRITSGFDDSNPKFGNRVYQVNYPFSQEFMIFERKSKNFSNIFLFEFIRQGIKDSIPLNLSNHNSVNRNATISYHRFQSNQIPSELIASSLIVWESNKFGKWDLIGKKYFPTTGWTDIIIDSSQGNKFNPDVVFINDSTYFLLYEQNDDVYYRIINTKSNLIGIANNLTNTPGIKEKNPKVTNFKFSDSRLYITFERVKNDSSSSLFYCRSLYNSMNFQEILLLDSVGHNTNAKYFNEFDPNSVFIVYEKTRNKKVNLFCKGINFSNQIINKSIVQDTSNQNKNYTNFMFGGSSQNISNHLMAPVFIYQKISKSGSNLIFASHYVYHYLEDTLYVGDTLANSQITLNYGIRSNDIYKVFAVYKKDLDGISSLFMKSKEIYTGSINQISSGVPDNFRLEQNYPNPFNAGTKIRFAVKDNNSIVNLSVYDVSGRLVKNLLNEKFDVGEYEYFYNAEELSSGVYFYSLKSGDFSETKRMVLVK
mgnify:CR=1 FL=1